MRSKTIFFTLLLWLPLLTKAQVNIDFSALLGKQKTVILTKLLNAYPIIHGTPADSIINFKIDTGYQLGVLFNSSNNTCKGLVVSASSIYKIYFYNKFSTCKVTSIKGFTRWHYGNLVITALDAEQPPKGMLFSVRRQ